MQSTLTHCFMICVASLTGQWVKGEGEVILQRRDGFE